MNSAPTTRRIYSETLPYSDVTAARTLALLRRFELSLVVAVRPWQLGAVGDVAKTLADAGIDLSVWPMLSDEEGRWANAGNAAVFAEFCERTIDAVPSAKELLLDLEPSFAAAQRLAEHPTRGLFEFVTSPARGFAQSERVLAALVTRLRARGVETSCAVWPLVALDPPKQHGWQQILGTPVDALAVSRVSVMVYTSILEGWSRGTVRRDDASALLKAFASRVVNRWGPRAALSLGCVGVGAFEDEPTYRTPMELAEDVGIVTSVGCTDLSLFDLGGVLARPPPEAWLEALFAAPVARPPERPRIRLARPIARALTKLVPLLGAFARRS